YFQRLGEVKGACDRLGLELIPSVFSVGYGGGALGSNRHLAEGLPVRNALLVAAEREARFEPEESVGWRNGGFEEHRGDRFPGYGFHDQPGEVSFADTTIRHSGEASIRLENFTSNPHGHGRVMQEVSVKPWRCYRVSLWVRTEELAPTSGFQISVLAGERSLAPRTFNLPPTGDWRQLVLVFNSFSFDKVRLYAGMWQGRAGRLWLDDWSIEEIGPMNALRRPGTPVTVRSEEGDTMYVEGEDYQPLEDPRFSPWNVDHEAPALKLVEGGRIKPGQRLRVSWYHPMLIHDSQVTLCMAEPELYEIYDREARLLAEHLQPKRVLLNMDEVRMGGTCAACEGRDMAQLLGECITRQVAALRRHQPEVQVMIWSDMLDPNHNAHGDYYLVQGSFAGSWRYVPKELTIAVWGGELRESSLRFFADAGFPVLAACYYDADNLDEVRRWREAARALPNVRGFMYTTWQQRYDLLEDFGGVVGQP
ncbi:MAG: hypothetical protein KDM81_12345, partial [Verrucomicrobiae bacterium]|nr:hypothetical protein [Verrucomicrobiae bacterium]